MKQTSNDEHVESTTARFDQTDVDAIPALLLTADQELKVRAVSDLWLHRFDFRRSELIGTSLLSLVHPESRSHMGEMFRRASLGTQIVGTVCDLATRRGERIETQWTVRPQALDRKGVAQCFIAVVTELTTQREAEKQLWDIHIRHSLALRASGVGIWEWRVPEDKWLWDDQMYRLYGISAKHESRIPDIWINAVHPEDRKTATSSLEDALAARQKIETEYRVRWPDGAVRHLRGVVRVLRNEGGKAIRLIGTAWDVTSQREIQEALRNSNERLELVLEGTSAGVWDQPDLGRPEEFWSSRFFDLLGYNLGEIPANRQTFLSLVHPEDRPRYELAYNTRLKDDGRFAIDCRLLRKDGIYRWFSILAHSKQQQDKTTRVAGSIQDVHSRRIAEQALDESIQRYELVIRGSKAGIWEWRRHGDGSLYWSPGLYEILGADPSIVQPSVEDFLGLIHPDDLVHFRTTLMRHLMSDSDLDMEIRVRTSRGYRWVRCSGQASRDSRGRAVRLAGSLLDIHPEKTALEDVVRSNEELDQFAYIASHDLREPLRGILNYAEFLNEDYGEALEGEGKDYLNRIQILTKRLEGYLDALLYYSRLGRTEEQHEPVDGNQVLGEILEEYDHKIRERNVEIVAHPLPVCVGDHLRLRLILTNLIQNAIRYNDKPTPRVEIGCLDPESTPTFYVRDNGIGIEERQLELIFTVFRRLHPKDHKWGDGNGVGLSLVKKAVERGGGRVWVESTPGVGSTFYFRVCDGIARRHGIAA